VGPVRALRYVVVDVFTDVALAGNQLAVFTDARGVETELMQALALEIGYSETVYVLPAEHDAHARIRIFTPRAELRFAGHPTLGSAFVLGGPLQLGVIRLETGAGVVPVTLERDESGAIVFGRMSQPVPTVQPAPEPERLLGALGVERSLLPIEIYDNGVRFAYVTLESAAAVAAVTPDFAAIARYDADGVSCLAGDGRRWKTRMFGPRVGVDEDPATGAAAGPLACHLARHGRIGWGDEIEISQGVEIGRPATLFARAGGDDGLIAAVEVGGSAVVVARGEFRVPV
jgi:trans-2,3-dihydro-3-hydroxyanthranilate isomerase